MANNDGYDKFDDKLILKIISEISPQVLEIKPGKKTISEGMFDDETWNSYHPNYHKTVIGHVISFLVQSKLIPFEYVGLHKNKKCNVFERIEIEPSHLIQPD